MRRAVNAGRAATTLPPGKAARAAFAMAVALSLAAVLAVSGGSRAAGPTTEDGNTICDANKDFELEYCPPEPYSVRTDFVTPSPARKRTRAQQLLFGQLSDVHEVDYGPLAVEPIDHYGQPFTAGYHPQNVTEAQAGVAMVERLNGIVSPVTGKQVENFIVTGDSSDNRQLNQVQRYVDTLDGDPVYNYSGQRDAKITSPFCWLADQKWAKQAYTGPRGNSWFYDPDASSQPNDPQPWIDGPGYSPYPSENLAGQDGYHSINPAGGKTRDFNSLFEAALGAQKSGNNWTYTPINSPGLDKPWYTSEGNHDGLWEGNIPDEILTPAVNLNWLWNLYSQGCVKVMPGPIPGQDGDQPDAVPGEPDLEDLGLTHDLAQDFMNAYVQFLSQPPQPGVEPELAKVLQQILSIPQPEVSGLRRQQGDGRVNPADSGSRERRAEPQPARKQAQSSPQRTDFEFMLVPGDPGRQILTRLEWMQQHFQTTGTPVGHGYTQANLDSCDPSNLDTCKMYYSTSPKPGIRYISLDTVNHQGYANGIVLDDQFQWLEGELQQARQNGELVIVYAHMSLRTTSNGLGYIGETAHFGMPVGESTFDGGTFSISPPHVGPVGEDLESLFYRYPNVIAYVGGHEHNHRIWAHKKPGGGGFWEVNTASHIDWPKQSRLIEVFDNCDGTLSLFNSVVDHAGLPNPYTDPGQQTTVPNIGNPGYETLASIGRELSYNDPQAMNAGPGQGGTGFLDQWGQDGPGALSDRNVELAINAPDGLRLPVSCVLTPPTVNLTVPPRVARGDTLTAFVDIQSQTDIRSQTWSLDGGSSRPFTGQTVEEPTFVKESAQIQVDTDGLRVGSTHTLAVTVTAGTEASPLTGTAEKTFTVVERPSPPAPPNPAPQAKRPTAWITSPKPNKRGRATVRRLKRIRGFADDVEDPIANVHVAIFKRRGKRCRTLYRNSFRKAPCNRPQFMNARLGKPRSMGLRGWTLRLSAKQRRLLRRGKFTIEALAVDRHGYVESSFEKGRNLVRVTVKGRARR